MKDFLRKLKSFYGLAGSLAILLPGFSFFIDYSPPLFDKINILTTALAAAFLWVGYRYPRMAFGNTNEDKALLRISLKLLVVAFLFIVFYLFFLDYTTAYIQPIDIRFQIGFNCVDWTLEEKAIQMIEEGECERSKIALIRCVTALHENIPKIWKQWTIYTAGLINLLTFNLFAIIWAYSWGILISTEK